VLDRLRERFPWLATPLAVHQRVSDVGGGPLSSSIALAGFLSLFPLLLLSIAVLGFVSAGDTDFAADVVDQLGLSGRSASQVLDVLNNAEDSRRAASVVGLAGLLWAGLGVVGTLEQALDATWQVTGRPGWKAKLIDLAWLAGAGLLFLSSMALAPAAAWLPGPAVVPTVVLGLALDTVLFLWMFRALTAVAVPWSDHLPGAIAGAVGLEVLKLLGGVYVPRAVSSSSALYGSLGVVFAILAWLALSARLVVYASAFNVVRHEQRHGTVTVEIKVPNIEGEVPLHANRGGAVAEVEPAEPGADAGGAGPGEAGPGEADAARAGEAGVAEAGGASTGPV
jgi:membrane protein